MRKLFFNFTVLIFIFHISCQSNKKNSSEENIPVIELGKSKDSTLLNLKFAIEHSDSNDSLLIFLAKGMLDGKQVGLQIDLSKSIPITSADQHPNLITDTLIANAVTFHSLGITSDQLLNSLAARFGVIQNKTFTKSGLRTSIFSLRNDEESIDDINEFQFTVYLAEEENTYAPMLKIHINKNENFLTIQELKEQYRFRIIELLSE